MVTWIQHQTGCKNHFTKSFFLELLAIYLGLHQWTEFPCRFVVSELQRCWLVDSEPGCLFPSVSSLCDKLSEPAHVLSADMSTFPKVWNYFFKSGWDSHHPLLVSCITDLRWKRLGKINLDILWDKHFLCHSKQVS